MKLEQLIDEAKEKNMLFRRTMEKKAKNGKKEIPMIWLFKHLENILGRAYCHNAAEQEIKRRQNDFPEFTGPIDMVPRGTEEK